MRGICLLLAILTIAVKGGLGQYCLSCEGCRPLDIQNAPGIGIELTVGYGTVVIRFVNGTVFDIAKIEGSESYIKAMKEMAGDSTSVAEGGTTVFQPLPAFPAFPEPERDNSLLARIKEKVEWDSWVKFAKNGFKPFRNLDPIDIPRTVLQPDFSDLPPHSRTWLEAVSPMITALKAAIETIQPLNNPYMFFALPDFAMRRRDIYLPYFQAAVQNGGLHITHSMGSSKAASEYIGGVEYQDEDDDQIYWWGRWKGPREAHLSPHLEPGSVPVKRVMVFDYSNHSISVTLLERDFGVLFPVRSAVNVDLGANIPRKFKADSYNEINKYSNEVRRLVRDSFNSTILNNVGYLIFTGDAVGKNTGPAKTFRTILYYDIFIDNPIINGYYETPLSLDDFFREEKECIFGGARLMAAIGRRWMSTGFETCVPDNGCPVGERDIDLDPPPSDDKEEKTEL